MRRVKALAETVPCPRCRAATGQPCSVLDGVPHMARFARAEKGDYKVRP